MSELPLSQENITIIVYAVFFGVLMAYLAYSFLKNRGKIQVMKQIPGGEVQYWRKKEGDGITVVMVKPKGKKEPGWSFKIEDGRAVKNKKRYWGLSSYQSVDIFPDAPSPIIFDGSIKPEDQPKWDKKTSKAFIEAEMVKKAGQEPKEKSNAGIWVVAILIIVSIIVTVMTSGRVRIG